MNKRVKTQISVRLRRSTTSSCFVRRECNQLMLSISFVTCGKLSTKHPKSRSRPDTFPDVRRTETALAPAIPIRRTALCMRIRCMALGFTTLGASRGSPDGWQYTHQQHRGSPSTMMVATMACGCVTLGTPRQKVQNACTDALDQSPSSHPIAYGRLLRGRMWVVGGIGVRRASAACPRRGRAFVVLAND